MYFINNFKLFIILTYLHHSAILTYKLITILYDIIFKQLIGSVLYYIVLYEQIFRFSLILTMQLIMDDLSIIICFAYESSVPC